jgi:hypothetical protein
MFPDLILLASAELPPSNAERPVIWCGACCRPAAGQWLQPLSAISCTDYGDVWRSMGNVAGKHGFYLVTFKKHPYTWVFIWSIFEIFYNMLTSTSLNQFLDRRCDQIGVLQVQDNYAPQFWVLVSDKVALHITPLYPTSITGPIYQWWLSYVHWAPWFGTWHPSMMRSHEARVLWVLRPWISSALRNRSPSSESPQRSSVVHEDNDGR